MASQDRTQRIFKAIHEAPNHQVGTYLNGIVLFKALAKDIMQIGQGRVISPPEAQVFAQIEKCADVFR
jgi:hypothetical protein